MHGHHGAGINNMTGVGGLGNESPESASKTPNRAAGRCWAWFTLWFTKMREMKIDGER
jgi:hypothetical protein